MAFISLLIANLILLVLVIGLISLILAIAFDVIWCIRKKKGKKVGLIHKILAVITSLGGIFLFIVPITIVFVIGGNAKISETKKLSEIEYKVEDYDLNDGFTMGDKELVILDCNMADNDKCKELVGALYSNKNESSDYYEIWSVENDGDFDIYMLKTLNKMLCVKGEEDDIMSLYENKANLNSKISWIDDDSKWHDVECELDKEIIKSIEKLHETGSLDHMADVDGIEKKYD